MSETRTRARDRRTEETAEANGGYTPSRSSISDGIPGKVRKTSNYDAWAGEIENLRTENLGKAFSYDNVPNASGLAQGLKRVYGVNAVVRDINTDKNSPNKGFGTLWIEYPATGNDEEGYVPDEAEVATIKSKYSQSV